MFCVAASLFVTAHADEVRTDWLSSTESIFGLSEPIALEKLEKQRDSIHVLTESESDAHLMQGECTEANIQEFLSDLISAAEKGHSWAARMLANEYRDGSLLPKNTKSMLFWYEQAGRNGDSIAAYELGHLYETGKENVPLNLETSREWYSKALPLMKTVAVLGVEPYKSELAYWVGHMHNTGRGTDSSPEDAAFWWFWAAHAGHSLAQQETGRAYMKGNGVKANPAIAVEWFTKASDAGIEFASIELIMALAKAQGLEEAEKKADVLIFSDPELEFMLGCMFREGKYLPKNLEKAFQWYRKAAEGGIDKAFVFMGIAYVKGEGAPKNYWKAYQAFSAAASMGNGFGRELRDNFREMALLIIGLGLLLILFSIYLRIRYKRKKQKRTLSSLEK